MDGNNKKYCKMDCLSRLSGLTLNKRLECHILAFLRQFKENHLLHDFRYAWDDLFGIEYLNSLKDIYAHGNKSVAIDPYAYGGDYLSFSYYTKDSHFYYLKEIELRKYIKRYCKLKGTSTQSYE